MKIAQVCALALLVVLGSAVAFADGIHDPRVIVGGGGGGGACEQCQGVGLNFSFTVPDNGTGTLFFTNESGKNWTSLKLIETGVPAADISCHSFLFESCKAETLKNGSVEILLSGVTRGGGGPLWKDRGIPNGTNFSIQFSCVGKSCWPAGLQFNAHASARVATTPEPETVGLMVTGLVGIFSRRKYWRNRFRG